MRTRWPILSALTLAIAGSAMAGTLDFATRVSCELQTASGTSLQRITWQQGTTPLLSIEQFRLGKAIAADTNTDAVVIIGPSATSQYYVAVTNQSTSGNSYLVQMPTIGTNTASGVWWYTVYFERDGRRYWTGNGALTIEATTSTGDGLVWQTITGVSVAALQSALDAEALARASGDLVAMTNWQARVNALTNGAALGATALQPPATNTLAAAAAHAATAHEISTAGGFRGGSDSEVTFGGAIGNAAIASDGGAVGDHASTDGGGAVGAYAYSEYGGAVGVLAKSASGGAVGYGALTSDGAAIGLGAYASTDGTQYGAGIDAIQLGTGGNTEPFSLQIYSNKLMHADGTIPVERLTLHNTNTAAHADIRALIPTLPGPGCTYGGAGMTLVITGAPPTLAWRAAPSNTLAVTVAPNAPRYWYSLASTAAPSWPAAFLVSTNTSGTSPFIYAIGPDTGTLWRVVGGGR